MALIVLIVAAALVPGAVRSGRPPQPGAQGCVPDAGMTGPAEQPVASTSAVPGVAQSATDTAPAGPDDPSTSATYTDTDCPLCGPERDLAPVEPPLRGPDVSELQSRLEELGYYHGPADGVYDSEVITAVRAFQREAGLEDDGVVGDVVWNALDDQHEAAFVTLGKPSGTPWIVINIDKRKLYVYFDQNLFATFPVAVGKPDSPTPIGEWHIADKDRNWGSGFGSRFMKLDVPWGIYGIHGTNKPWSIGQAMSGGCIRMLDRHVERVFELVPVGARVRITGTLEVRRLCRGDRGSDVMEFQAALAEAGFFEGEIDGFFGAATEQALLKFQRARGLQPNGQVGKATYNELGM